MTAAKKALWILGIILACVFALFGALAVVAELYVLGLSLTVAGAAILFLCFRAEAFSGRLFRILAWVGFAFYLIMGLWAMIVESWIAMGMFLAFAAALFFLCMHRSPEARAEAQIRRQTKASERLAAAEQARADAAQRARRASEERAKQEDLFGRQATSSRKNIIPVAGIAAVVAVTIFGGALKFIDANTSEHMMSGRTYTPEEVTQRPAPTAAADPLAGISLGRKNAIKSAESYLNYSSFSRKGLVDQLRFEGYTSDEAVYACDYLEPDWYAEAAEAAASYLRYTSFSRQGLIDQLLFEGFTEEEAEYGVTAAGY